MWQDVLETYRCLLSCRKNLPGMRIEDAFKTETIASLEKEYAWLQQQATLVSKDKKLEPDGFIIPESPELNETK